MADINAIGSKGKPRVAVYKFSSCDGCQLQLLNLEDELLELMGAVEIAYFLEARRRELPPPYDIGLVEGSISTPDEEERIHRIRRDCRFLVAIGACATSGGIQALRNWADVEEFTRAVYAHPEYIKTLDTATPIAAHVFVDFELRGCPVNQYQLLELVSAILVGAPAADPDAQRVHRVQDEGHPVPAGIVGRAVPGTADAGRLRGPVPELQPAVLRVLRPDGTAQRRLAGPALPLHGEDAGGVEPHDPVVQWIPRTLQTGE